MRTSTLTSLAILKVNWDQRGIDYIENFVPFVVECAQNSPEDVISLPSIRVMLLDNFGLALPHHALRMIITRATKRGFFRRKNNILYTDREECDSLDFKRTKKKVESTYEKIIEHLRTFVHDRHQESWTHSDAEAAILDFLRDDSLTFLFNFVEPTHKIQHSGDRRFLVASFIGFLQQSHRSILNDLVLLARGQLFANALYLPHASGIRKRFRNTAIYFDTRFLIFAAGFAGPDRAAPCLDLLELCSRYGADLRSFIATHNELQGIVNACASRLRTRQLRYAHGPIIEYFIETKKTASDLELMVVRLPNKLKRLGITVVNAPPFDKHKYQVDESALENHLDRAIGYNNPKARVHDVNCISAINRLRRGRRFRDVEECRAIFVTTNTKLVEATRQQFSYDHGEVSLAITDDALANLLWLKDPAVASSLPRKQLIANAYAAMQPSERLWQLYLKEIASLQEEDKVTEEEYMLLRYSLSAKYALMDLTHGQTDAFTDGTVPEILQHAVEKISARSNAEIESKNQRIRRTEEELQKRDEDQLAQRQHLRSVARRFAKIARIALTVPICLLLGFGMAQTFSWTSPPPTKFWLEYLGALALLIAFVLALASIIFGTTVIRVTANIEDYIARLVTSVLFRLVGPPDNPDEDN